MRLDLIFQKVKKKKPTSLSENEDSNDSSKKQNRHSIHETPRNDLSRDTSQLFFFFLRGTQNHDSLLRDRITNLKIYVTRVHQPNLSHPRLSLKNPSLWSIKKISKPICFKSNGVVKTSTSSEEDVGDSVKVSLSVSSSEKDEVVLSYGSVSVIGRRREMEDAVEVVL